ncbi:hypothetical protein KY359_00425 [Candidatus Woesearchaeota archaeon]|nr:hypothetical protein [Candidatus Woesearchaeota archaeon]
MRGFRRVDILVVVLLTALALAACSGCAEKKPIVTKLDKRPITQTVEIYAEEPYTVQESRVTGQKCIERHYSEMNDSRFNMSIAEKEWVRQPPVPGETNNLRRIVTIFNARDEVDAVYLDKIYLYDGKETKRSKTPMMFLVDPKSTRTLYVMWDTQYDPLKDVTVDYTNNTEVLGFETTIMRMCYNETEDFNVTKYRKVVTGTTEEVVGYDEVVRVKLPKK